MSFVIHHPELDTDKVVPEHTLGTYARRGWVIAGRHEEASAPDRPEMDMPARSASAAEWRTYAVVAGMSYEDAMAAKRDELADKYAPAPPAEPKRPQKNDSTESWRTYAVANGMTPDEAASMGRDEIVAHFTTEES